MSRSIEIRKIITQTSISRSTVPRFCAAHWVIIFPLSFYTDFVFLTYLHYMQGSVWCVWCVVRVCVCVWRVWCVVCVCGVRVCCVCGVYPLPYIHIIDKNLLGGH